MSQSIVKACFCDYCGHGKTLCFCVVGGKCNTDGIDVSYGDDEQ